MKVLKVIMKWFHKPLFGIFSRSFYSEILMRHLRGFIMGMDGSEFKKAAVLVCTSVALLAGCSISPVLQAPINDQPLGAITRNVPDSPNDKAFYEPSSVVTQLAGKSGFPSIVRMEYGKGDIVSRSEIYGQDIPGSARSFTETETNKYGMLLNSNQGRIIDGKAIIDTMETFSGTSSSNMTNSILYPQRNSPATAQDAQAYGDAQARIEQVLVELDKANVQHQKLANNDKDVIITATCNPVYTSPVHPAGEIIHGYGAQVSMDGIFGAWRGEVTREGLYLTSNDNPGRTIQAIAFTSPNSLGKPNVVTNLIETYPQGDIARVDSHFVNPATTTIYPRSGGYTQRPGVNSIEDGFMRLSHEVIQVAELEGCLGKTFTHNLHNDSPYAWTPKTGKFSANYKFQP